MVGIGSMLIICAQMLIVMQKPKGGGGLGNSKIFLFGLGSGGRSKQN